jgi:hypothetical protein
MICRPQTYKPWHRIASGIVKVLWIGFLALLPTMAMAASPEQAYLAARDAQVRRLTALSKPNPSSDKVLKEHERAVAELEKQLKRIIGPSALSLSGLPAGGKINNNTLTKGDLGFGMLDGISYGAEDDKTQAVVTTEGLFKVWLREHRKWWRDNNVPQDPASALRHTSFYTQAVSSGAAVSKYVELPIKKPAAASLAFAMLSIRAQDVGPWEPDDVMMALLQGGKLYLVRVKSAAKIGPFPPCQALWDEAMKKSQAEFERHQANPNARTPSRQMSIEDEGYAAFRRCFAERAPREKGFADLVRQAQEIADRLPAK